MSEKESWKPVEQLRREDMSNTGLLSVSREPDGDVVVTIFSEDGNMASVEFTASGGRSPHTLKALRNLHKAMEKDNQAGQNFIPQVPKPSK